MALEKKHSIALALIDLTDRIREMMDKNNMLWGYIWI